MMSYLHQASIRKKTKRLKTRNLGERGIRTGLTTLQLEEKVSSIRHEHYAATEP